MLSLIALLLLTTPQAQAATVCSATPPRGTYVAWRMIDGRKCWYAGKPGMNKSLLAWGDPAGPKPPPQPGEEPPSPAPPIRAKWSPGSFVDRWEGIHHKVETDPTPLTRWRR